MCGICGFIGKKNMPEELLTEMIDEIRYRGPDDRGVYTDRMACGFQVGLAHRRLAILDLSENGHQPMISESGRMVISFNGEVYNFRTLRKELEQKGCRFRTGTDTEVILYAWETWGAEAVNRMNGMFAFAIYDREEQCVWLVRDRMGVKPLYYYTNGEELMFASELKPLMKHPDFRTEIDRDALTLYLAAEYIPGRQSIFRDTFKLLPGEILKWTPERITTRRYWSVPEVAARQDRFRGSYDEALEELNALVEDAVRLRMISDVPLGAFLSNGVDSTLMTAKMQKISAEPVKTFTVGFEEADFDGVGRQRIRHRNLHGQRLGGRNHLITGNIGRCDRLHPDRLPDAAHGRVPDAVGMKDLLASGLLVVVRAVQHLQDEFLLPLLYIRSNVETECRISALVGADIPAVQPEFSRIVHRTEVQQDPILPFLRKGERCRVPERIVPRHGPADAGQGRLHAERNQDPPVESLRLRSLRGCDGIVPQSIQGQPVGTDHLRARIFRKRSRRIQVIGPLRTDTVAGRLPFDLGFRSRTGGKRSGRQKKKKRFFHKASNH